MQELIQELQDENKQLKEKITEYQNKFGTYTKEQCQLFQKIQKVKKVLLNSNISKSGYNSYNKYNYFELQDITPVIIPALLEENLASKFYTNNERIYLQIIDTTTGAWDQVSTKLRIYERDTQPKGDLTYLMKDEQAAQTYARRTLWLLMLDIVEPVPEQAEKTATKKKTNNTKTEDPQKTYELTLPENTDEVTKSIFQQIKQDFGTRVEYNKITISNKLKSMKNRQKIDENMYKNCIETLEKM